jgi:protein-tyrosine phosphatase
VALGLAAGAVVVLTHSSAVPIAIATPVATISAAPSSAGASTSGSPSATSSATVAAATVRLSGAPNFRDLAGNGAGLAIAGGDHLARGVVYRSGKLNELTNADLTALRNLGLVEIYDLRTPDVAGRAPDPKLPGVEDHLINLYGLAKSASTKFQTVAAARARFRQLNSDFVTDPEQRRRLRGVLEQIAAADGPVLVHCTEGKDRTGWVSAMLQYVAGADDQTVLASYLESNQYRAAVIEAEYAARKKAEGTLAAEIYLAQSRVEPEYLQAGLAAAKSRYGSVSAYLRSGVGLSEKTIQRLRTKLIAG